MSSRLPRAASASAAAPASHPPAGLDGLEPAFSRLVTVAEHAVGGTGPTGAEYVWHILDNGRELEALGVEPVGTILCVHGNPTWSYLWRRLVSDATKVAKSDVARIDAANSDVAGIVGANSDVSGIDGAKSRAGSSSPGAWRVIAVDQLEMGFSERTGTVRPLARRVQDLADFTAAIGLDDGVTPVVTFGHDWGGVVSLGWAVDHPNLLAGVMLLNTAIHQPDDVPIPAPLRLALKRSILPGATVLTPAFLATTLALAHPPLARAIKSGYHAPYRGAARRRGIGAFVTDIPVDAGHPSAPELDRIAAGVRSLGHDAPVATVPALMLWGPRDPIFSDRYLDDLTERMPHADVHRFEGAGHLVAEDRDYAAAALTWLSDQARSGAFGADQVGATKDEGATAPSTTTPSPSTSTPIPSSATPIPSSAPPNPLWHYLDELRDSSETALIEMVPPTGGGPRVLSWRLLSRRVREIAVGLAAIGVKKGDRVSLLVPPGADLTAVLYACVRIGAIVVVADAGLGLRGLTRAVRGARPDHVIGALPGLIAARALGWPGQKISVARLPRVSARALGVAYTLADIAQLGEAKLGEAKPGEDEQLPPAPQPDDTAAVLFTSGSTGPAKGVVYTHAQLSGVCQTLSAQYDIGVGTGLVAGFAPFALLGPALGTSSVTPDMDVTSPKTLTAVAVAQAVAAVDATVVFLSPAAIANVVATSDALSDTDRRALAGVKTFLSAGAPVSEQLLSAASDLMPKATAHTPYGMTEGLLMTDIALEGIREALAETGTGPGGVCVGMPAATTTVRISALDAHGLPTGLPAGTPGITGEIVVSAPHIKDHYDRLWLTNRAAEHDTATHQRWHRTGDVGHLDASGRLWIEGRLPHVITTADGVVTPVGPEQHIESLAAVVRAAVVGIGPNGTQQLVAVVETTDVARRVSLAEPALAASVRASIDRPLAAVLVVPRLPTDIRHNSKIDRSLLSAWAEKILAGGRMARP